MGVGVGPELLGDRPWATEIDYIINTQWTPALCYKHNDERDRSLDRETFPRDVVRAVTEGSMGPCKRTKQPP